MDEDRRGAALVDRCDRRVVIGLQRARAALDHAVDGLEVARIIGERDRDRRSVDRLVGALGTVMVLDVAGHVVVFVGVAAQVGRLELEQNFLVGPIDDVRDRAETAAMRHADDGSADAVARQFGDDLLEHRDHHVETFDRERLLAEVGLAQVALERLDLR